MPNSSAHPWSTKRLQHWFVKSWQQAFCDTVELMDLAGSIGVLDLSVHEPNPQIWKSWQDPQWLAVSLDAADGGQVYVGCARETAQGLIRAMFPDPESEDTWLSTFNELLSQAFGGTTEQFRTQCRRTVQYGPPAVASPPEEPAAGVEFRFPLGDATHAIALAPNAEIAAILDGRAEGEAEPEAGQASTDAVAERPGQTPSAKSNRGDEPRMSSDNLDLLLEVELDLSISFGKTTLPLGDVLKFSAGAIVELNRSVTDPVEVIVNDSVVARGDVVVVEGNYGIRITEIVSRRERLQNAL